MRFWYEHSMILCLAPHILCALALLQLAVLQDPCIGSLPLLWADAREMLPKDSLTSAGIGGAGISSAYHVMKIKARANRSLRLQFCGSVAALRTCHLSFLLTIAASTKVAHPKML
jgi:hypothetical protein